MSLPPVLEVRNLTVEIPVSHRRVVRAVDRVGFSVRRAEALALVGESGCGKTMTLRAIVGLLPTPARIVEGQVILDGTDLVRMSRKDLRQVRGRRVSIIFQEPTVALNPVMRVGNQIAEGPAKHLGLSRRSAQSRAVQLMAQVGIADPERRARSYPHELSGGMRQRVMIAVALSCEPRLILCDEPTTALDVTIQDQILKLLMRLRREAGVSIVFVTHDLAVVAETCDRLAVMYAGQIVETGPVTEVVRQPRHPYTLGLLRSVPMLDQDRRRLASLPGAPPNLAAPPTGCRFHPRCPFATQECKAGEFPLIEIAPHHMTACIHHEHCVEPGPTNSWRGDNRIPVEEE